MQWIPESINELNDLLNEGLFDETHYRDAKRQISVGVSGSKELARDLASFAIDGGLLFVGVAESGGQFVVEPQDLKGVAERIEQVARTRVSPPLTVRTVTLLSAEDSTKGVLVVVVPPSPVAPHMVDHKYLGRGDKTKYELDDAEVFRLHERRKLWERSADTLLDEEMARDPYGGPPNERSHLFIVAEPVGARSDGLLAIVPDDGWIRFLMDLVNTRTKPPLVATQFSPNLHEATYVRNRPGGWGLSTYGISGARTVTSDSRESSQLDLELRHNGGVRLFCGRLVYEREEEDNGIFDAIAFGLFQHVLQLCKTISVETEFLGSWDIGCAMTNIRGTISHEHFQSYGGLARSHVYSEDGYRRVSRCTFEELTVPGAVTERVLGAFMRALGTRKLAKYASYFPN